MCKQHTELNVLVCCLSRVRKRTIYDGLENHGRVSCTPAELSSLRHFGVEKIFVRLIFDIVGHRRNIFNDENFSIYGTIHNTIHNTIWYVLHTRERQSDSGSPLILAERHSHIVASYPGSSQGVITYHFLSLFAYFTWFCSLHAGLEIYSTHVTAWRHQIWHE